MHPVPMLTDGVWEAHANREGGVKKTYMCKKCKKPFTKLTGQRAVRRTHCSSCQKQLQERFERRFYQGGAVSPR